MYNCTLMIEEIANPQDDVGDFKLYTSVLVHISVEVMFIIIRFL
jgi:hypothetical protein